MSTEQSKVVNPQQFQQTKDRIKLLVGEIAQLSKQGLEAEDYYKEVMQRVVTALAAAGGAVWTAGEGGRAKVAYQINVPEKLIQRDSEEGTRHYALLDQALRGGQPGIVPPLSGEGDKSGPGNPTKCLLLLAPLKADDHTEGILEVFQRPNTPVEAQRGYLDFLLRITDMVGDWLKSRRLRHFSDRQSLWTQADEFASLVHESLDLQQAAFVIANEGRRLIECDRVSVAVGDGNYCYIQAVSGQDTPDDRSNVITMLSDLATSVVAAGEPLYYEGVTEDLPPQIEEKLQAYIDESHTRSIAVLPLHRHSEYSERSDEQRERPLGEVIGALIIEQIEDPRERDEIQPRIDLVRRHSALALANALDHSNLFLMPLWQFLGKLTWIFGAKTRWKTAAITALIVAGIAALFLVPWNFDMESKGSFQPVVKQDIFAGQDGIVTQVLVEHNSEVQVGQTLVVMRNTELEVKYQDTLGQKQTAEGRLAAVERLLVQPDIPVADRNKLAGEKAELLERIKGLERQLELLQTKREQLTVKSPIAGKVITWNVRENLLQRPVQRGQSLITIADPKAEWELEVHVPENQVGHIQQAQREIKEKLDVTFIPLSDPSKSYTGTVREIENAAQMFDEAGHGVKVHVQIPAEQQPIDPRPGATVTAKIHCGERSLGYVLFHSVWEWIQTYILF